MRPVDNKDVLPGSLAGQFDKITEELQEAMDAYSKGDKPGMLEELTDVKCAVETALAMCGLDEANRRSWERFVENKNKRRGYYVRE